MGGKQRGMAQILPQDHPFSLHQQFSAKPYRNLWGVFSAWPPLCLHSCRLAYSIWTGNSIPVLFLVQWSRQLLRALGSPPPGFVPYPQAPSRIQYNHQHYSHIRSSNRIFVRQCDVIRLFNPYIEPVDPSARGYGCSLDYFQNSGDRVGSQWLRVPMGSYSIPALSERTSLPRFPPLA